MWRRIFLSVISKQKPQTSGLNCTAVQLHITNHKYFGLSYFSSYSCHHTVQYMLWKITMIFWFWNIICPDKKILFTFLLVFDWLQKFKYSWTVNVFLVVDSCQLSDNKKKLFLPFPQTFLMKPLKPKWCFALTC